MGVGDYETVVSHSVPTPHYTISHPERKSFIGGYQLASISTSYQDHSLLAITSLAPVGLDSPSPVTRGSFVSCHHNPSASPHLWKAVTTINNDIRSRRVARRITGKVQVRALELVRLALTTHRDLVLPDRLRLRWHEVANLCRHVARADRVGAREAYPLDGEGLACVCVSNLISSQIVCTTVAVGVCGDVQR